MKRQMAFRTEFISLCLYLPPLSLFLLLQASLELMATPLLLLPEFCDCSYIPSCLARSTKTIIIGLYNLGN